MVGERKSSFFFFFSRLGGGGVPEIFQSQPWRRSVAGWADQQPISRAPAGLVLPSKSKPHVTPLRLDKAYVTAFPLKNSLAKPQFFGRLPVLG